MAFFAVDQLPDIGLALPGLLVMLSRRDKTPKPLSDCSTLDNRSPMTFLPIVDRELRVAARRHSTHSMRLAVALAAILIGLFFYAANLRTPSPRCDPVEPTGSTLPCSHARRLTTGGRSPVRAGRPTARGATPPDLPESCAHDWYADSRAGLRPRRDGRTVG